jgi:hypothetical protein
MGVIMSFIANPSKALLRSGKHLAHISDLQAFLLPICLINAQSICPYPCDVLVAHMF